jgi:hypothetical protein
MSQQVPPDFDDVDLATPICDACGGEITETDQECPGRDEGVCAP